MSTPAAEPDEVFTHLTEDEQEALRDWWDDEGEGATSGSMLGNLDAAVERILAARMATAKVDAWYEGYEAGYDDARSTANPHRAHVVAAICAALGHDDEAGA